MQFSQNRFDDRIDRVLVYANFRSRQDSLSRMAGVIPKHMTS